MLRRAVPVFLVLLSFSTNLPAIELNLTGVSVSGGAINHVSEHMSGNVFCPEVLAEGVFLHPALRWGLSWGYWNEDNRDPQPFCIDPVGPCFYPFSYRGLSIGGRIAFLPHRNPSNPTIFTPFAGMSRHLLRVKMADNGGNLHAERSWPDYSTIDAGLAFAVHIRGPFSVRGEARLMHPIAQEEEMSDRVIVNAGVTYSLR